MPDMERLTDQLSVDLAKTPEQKAWAKGFIEGKNRARSEVALLLSVVALIIVAIKQLT